MEPGDIGIETRLVRVRGQVHISALASKAPRTQAGADSITQVDLPSGSQACHSHTPG